MSDWHNRWNEAHMKCVELAALINLQNEEIARLKAELEASKAVPAPAAPAKKKEKA